MTLLNDFVMLGDSWACVSCTKCVDINFKRIPSTVKPNNHLQMNKHICPAWPYTTFGNQQKNT